MIAVLVNCGSNLIPLGGVYETDVQKYTQDNRSHISLSEI